MLHPLKKFTQTKGTASAKVVDGKLILSFPHALTPVVWQMDLTEVKASALEVLHNEESGAYTLTLKTPKGEKLDAATFENRESAVEGLMAASQALENAQGCIRGQTAANTNAIHAVQTPKKKGRWAMGITAIVLLILVFGMWGTQAPRAPSSFEQAASTSPSNPAESSGVPVSADDFLSGL